MRHSHFLAISFFLFGALLFLPLKANAGTIETVETIFDVVHTADSSVPSGSDIEPLIRCLADKGSNVGACAEAAGAEGPYLDTVVQLYEAVTADNFGQIVGITYQWLKEDAPCIIMDILTGGTAGSLCDLVKEVVEALANVGKAVLEFFADVGAAVGEAVQDVGCAIGLGGCDKSSPPDQLAYAWVYAPKIGDAVAARESSDPAAYSNLLKALRAQASSKPAQLNIDLPAGFKLEFPDWAVTNAEKVFAQVVTQYWDADMVKSPGGILWAIEQSVESISTTNRLFSPLPLKA